MVVTRRCCLICNSHTFFLLWLGNTADPKWDDDVVLHKGSVTAGWQAGYVELSTGRNRRYTESLDRSEVTSSKRNLFALEAEFLMQFF